MNTKNAIITSENLSFSYDEGKPVFEDISFSLKTGKLYALMGGNGSGKTTVLRCLTGLLPGYTGSITMNGSRLETISRKELSRLMSIVPQEHTTIFPYLVKNMVLMGRAPYVDTFATPGKIDRDLVRQAMEEVGILPLSDKLYTRISGGERQLVLIARAMAQSTPVMVLDEPTSHLDFRNQILILSHLKRLVVDRGLLAIVAIHDPNHALHFADEVMILNRGRITESGPPGTVLNRATIRDVYSVEVEEIRRDGKIRGVIPVNHIFSDTRHAS